MITKFIRFKNFGRFKDTSFGREKWCGKLEKVNVIYANNGSGKTTISLMFRSLKGMDELILKKRSFSSNEPPEIILLAEDQKEVKFLKGRWNRYDSKIEVFDSYFIEDNVYIITVSDNLRSPTIFEVQLGAKSVETRKAIVSCELEISKLKKKKTYLRNKKNNAETAESRASYRMKFENAMAKSRELREKVQELEAQIIEETEGQREVYQERINHYLSMFNRDLKITNLTARKHRAIYTLQVSGYALNPSNDDRYSLRYSLSEGDKYALSLSFFLARLDILPDLDQKTIVVDDPITSFDYGRRNTTLNNLYSLSGKVKTLVLLTHDLMFAHDFSRKFNYKCQNIKIEFNGNTSYFLNHDVQGESLTGIFKDLTVLHNYISNGATTDIERREVARCIRPVLEGIFRIKFFPVITSTTWLGDIIMSIREEPIESIYGKYKPILYELSEINDYSKEYHHSSPHYFETPINDQELRNFVVRTLDVLKEI